MIHFILGFVLGIVFTVMVIAGIISYTMYTKDDTTEAG